MRILQLYRDLGWGGIQSHVRTLCRGLKDAGHEVVFAGPWPSMLGTQLNQAGVRCIDLPMRGLYDLRSHWRLLRLLQQEHFDVVHSHARRATFYAARARRFTGIPIVATAHTTNAWKSFGDASYVISVSKAVAQKLIEKHILEERLSVIHNGIPAPLEVDRKSIKAERLKLGLSETDVAIAMSGRFIPEKGHDLMLDAVAKIANNLAGFKVFFIGSDGGEYARSIERLVVQKRLENRVVIVPFLDDVVSFLNMMDIMVLPSRREGLPITLLEGGALGLATVVSRVGGMPEVVSNRVNGLVFESENVSELSECLRVLCENSETRRYFAQRLREKILAEFSASTMVDKIVSVYESASRDSALENKK